LSLQSRTHKVKCLLAAPCLLLRQAPPRRPAELFWAGIADLEIPELTIGQLVLEALARRHALLTLDGEGEA
jgi:hypothetical protein